MSLREQVYEQLRDSIEDLGRILVTSREGAQIPLAQVAELRYVRGPQAIKSEDTFLVGYVIFDKRAGRAEVDVVAQARDHLERLRQRLDKLEVAVPHADMAKRDPWALRVLGMGAVVLALAVVGDGVSDRLQSAFRFASLSPAAGAGGGPAGGRRAPRGRASRPGGRRAPGPAPLGHVLPAHGRGDVPRGGGAGSIAGPDSSAGWLVNRMADPPATDTFQRSPSATN